MKKDTIKEIVRAELRSLMTEQAPDLDVEEGIQEEQKKQRAKEMVMRLGAEEAEEVMQYFVETDMPPGRDYWEEVWNIIINQYRE